MTAFSNYLEDNIIDITLRGQPWTAPSVFVALFTDAASLAELEEGTLTNEISTAGTDYARQAVAFTPSANGATQNTADVDFPQAIGTWGTVRYAAIIDTNDAVTPTGNILYYGQLSVDKIINTNDTFKFNLGDLDVTVD